MNRTLQQLRAQCGPPQRFRIDAEPARRKRTVVTTVIWPCGCIARGAGLSRLELVPCAVHGAGEPARGTFGLPHLAPFFQSLVSRPNQR